MVIGVFGGFKGVVGFLLSGSLVLGWVFILSGSLVLGWKVCNPTLSKLKVFEEPILNKIVEASVERLFSRHKQIHSPLRASLGYRIILIASGICSFVEFFQMCPKLLNFVIISEIKKL